MKFEDAIVEIKRRVDIVRVIGETVKLKRSGTNWTGLCPFHPEKTPSFYVRADKGYYKCFGCDASGDVFTFIEKQTGQLFADIVRRLASEAGVSIDEPVRTREETERMGKREQLAKILTLAHGYFTQALTGARGEALPLAYLVQERKFTPELIEARQIGFGGFDDKAFGRFLEQSKIDPQLAEELGLLRQGNHGAYGFFSKRIVVPIRDHKGRLVGFGGRAFGSFAEGKPKYVNSPTSLVYDKSRVLYGLFESLPLMKQGAPVVMAEGYFDVMALQDVGVAALAPCGTSLTPDHIQLLGRYTRKVVLCLDGDAAGRAAHQKVLLMLLKEGFEVRAVKLDDKDPDDLWRAGKKRELRAAIDQARDAVEVLVQEITSASLVGVAERVAAIRSLLPYLSASPSPLVNRQYVRLAAQGLKEDESLIVAEIQKIAPGSVAPASKLARRVTPKKEKVRWSETHKLIFRALVSQPQIAKRDEMLAMVGLNSELQDFVQALHHAWQKMPTLEPAELLRHIPIQRDSALIELLQDHGRHSQLISEEEAQRILQGYLDQVLVQEERKAMGKNHQDLLSAQKEGDLGRVRQALETQSAGLKKKRIEKQASQPVLEKVAKASITPFAPAPQATAKEEWEEDEGWT